MHKLYKAGIIYDFMNKRKLMIQFRNVFPVSLDVRVCRRKKKFSNQLETRKKLALGERKIERKTNSDI